ncbi:MAG: hypothetical protein IH940_06615 [Acidobacteria bacterium]|nr:hypothetical protein [Acidobacteriota bacterium]
MIVQLGATGAVNIYNHEGSAHVLFDVAGYFTNGSGGSNVEVTTSARSSLAAASGPLAASDAGIQVELGTREEAIADLENAELTPLDDSGFSDEGTALSGNFASGTITSESQRDPYWAGYLPKKFNDSVGRYYGLFEVVGGFSVATCSATVVDTNMIITAGHCVLNGSQFADYVMFVPGQNGTVSLPSNFISTNKVWFASNVFIPAKYPGSSTGDYAFLPMFKNAGKNLASKYEPIPFIYGYGNQAPPWMWQMGYPAEGYFQDGSGPDNSNQGRCPSGVGWDFECDPYSCLSKPGDNSFVKRSNGERFARMACYIAGGASGGPIFGWYKLPGEKARWWIMSVVSHGTDPRLSSEARPGDSFVDTPGCDGGLRECLWYGTGFYMAIFNNTTFQLYQQAAAG